MMKYYFCGIGGIGMSSIAQYFANKGNQVSGSDRSFDLNENKKMKTLIYNMAYNTDYRQPAADGTFALLSQLQS